ncbi:hypothetical protein AX14_014248 [Amanita brunnescens Koide BX004]|nr:hypothetical protein AX14_014248 [Amanita brunnescens Koide BX004]
MFATTQPASSAGAFLSADPYLPQTGPSPDPNSPETFRQNLQLVQQHTMQVQSLARSALAGIQNAYHPGTNPSQTSSDLANLKQAIQLLLKVMRQSGVGGLPLLALPSLQGTDAAMSVGETLGLDAANTGTGGITSIQVPSEEKLLEDTTNGIKVLFERQKRSQESAAVVANLLASTR